MATPNQPLIDQAWELLGYSDAMEWLAAAVIGGPSLFGGRGKPLDGVLGGLVIAAIYNGIYLLGMSAAAQDLIFALVLLAAVSADVLARRGQASRRA